MLVEFPDDGVQVSVLESHVTSSDRHRGLLGRIKPAGVPGEEAALLPLLLPLLPLRWRRAADGEELRLPGGRRMRAVVKWRLKWTKAPEEQRETTPCHRLEG